MSGVVQVNINGRSFRMACDDGQEEHLLALSRQVDEKITFLKGAFGEIGDVRLTMMAAIMLADELDEANRTLKAKESEISALQLSLNSQSNRVDGLENSFAETLNNTASHIEKITEKLKK